MASLEARKAETRKQLKGVLASVTDPARRSEAIVARLLGWMPFQEAGTVMAFLPIGGEADVMAAAEAVLGRGSRLLLPRVDWTGGTMAAVEVGSLTEGLVVGRAGLREPGPDMPTVPVGEVDLILVPGLGFDARGGRIGRGAGFYDRFLAPAADASGRVARACGIGFDAQVAEEIPMGPMDIRLGAVATDSRLILT